MMSSAASSGTSTSEKPIGDLDRADVGRVDARFVGDRADQIARPHAGFATEAM